VHLVATTIIAAVFYGLLRIRIGAEVALVGAAAVPLEAVWARLASRRRRRDASGTESPTDDDPPSRSEELQPGTLTA
jgi:hypothetical protein